MGRNRFRRRVALLTVLVATGLVLAPAASEADFGLLGGQTRISKMGDEATTGAGRALLDGFSSATVYNPSANEYLVVWCGDDDVGTVVDNEFEMYAQRLSAAGVPLEGRIRVSDMGPDGGTGFGAFDMSVAYNPTANEYLVVWAGDDDIAPLVDGEQEVFGQRLTAAGVEIGPNDFRISDMGPNGDTNFFAGFPAVAYNPTANEYLVTWTGDDNTPPLVDNEREIFGQRLSAASATETGANDFRISDMGTNGAVAFDAADPAVAYNPTANEYLVTWSGDDNTPPLVDNEKEIFAQRLTGAAAAELGANDFRVSDMGTDGSTTPFVATPRVTANPVANEYLVVWAGDDNIPPLVAGEQEIFAQRLTGAAGAATGANDFRVSDMGPDGNLNFGTGFPDAAYNATTNEYLVAWHGDDDTAPLVNDEFEIFAQRLSGSGGGSIGTNDFRVSAMGPDGNAGFRAFSPALAANPSTGEFMLTWESDDNTAPLVDDEHEVYGRRLGELPVPPVVVPPTAEDPPTPTLLVRRAATLVSAKLAGNEKSLTLAIACPSDSLDCADGTVKLRTKKKLVKPRLSRDRAKRKRLALGSAAFSIGSGQTDPVKLKLNSTARKLLSQDPVKARATLTVPDGASAPLRSAESLTIKPRR